MLPTPLPRSLHQHVVPRPHLGLGDHAVPGGVGGDGQSRGLGEVHRVGNDVGVHGGRGDVLGMAAVQVHAQAFLVAAPLVVAHAAMLAASAGNAVVQDDPVADLQGRGGGRADCGHLSSDVATHNARQRAVIGAAFPKVEVQVVQGASPHPEHDFAGADLGIGAVPVDQLIGAAVLVDKDRFHMAPPSSIFRCRGRCGLLWT